MKKLLSALVAVSTLAVAAPALADAPYAGRGQDRGSGAERGYGRGDDDRGEDRGYDRYDRGTGYDRGSGYDRGHGYGDTYLRDQIRRLDIRVERARERGWVSHHEARRLQWQVDEMSRLLRSYYRNDGRLNRWESSDLQMRIDRVKAGLRYSRFDYGGYGGWDRQDRGYGEYSRRGAR
jgi:Ni/Co efflux regulator RcnB